VGKNLTDAPRWLKRGRRVSLEHLTGRPKYLKRRAEFHEARWRVWKTFHSEGFIEWLAEVGVNNITTHFFTGRGLAAESESIELLGRLLWLCRRHGIKVNASIQFGSMLFEDLTVEMPEAAGWGRTDALGFPISYDGEAFRRRTCQSNVGWTEYVKKCLAYALNELKVDGIFFKGFSFVSDTGRGRLQNEVCHCERCIDAFRRYLKDKFRDNPGIFGIKSFDRVLIPKDLSRTRDPIVREYLAFADDRLSSLLRQFVLYAKMFKNDVAVITDGSLLPWHNPYKHAGYCDGVCWRDTAFARWEDDCMITQIHACKLAAAVDAALIKMSDLPLAAGGSGLGIGNLKAEGRAMRPRSLTPSRRPPGGDWRLPIAEGLAFAGSPGQLPPLEYLYLIDREGRAVADTRRYLRFYRKNSRLFERKSSAATVAIYYSTGALIRDFIHQWAALRGMEQILLQNGIPFELILPEELSEKLGAFDVLIIPDVPFISSEAEDIIRKWVAGGGGLYASGRTSRFDEALQKKSEYGLGDVFGVSSGIGNIASGNLRIRRFRKGSVCFTASVPERVVFLDNEGRPLLKPQDVSFKHLVKFKLPPMHSRIARIIKNLSARGMPLEVAAPLSVAVDACYIDRALLVHLLNFEYEIVKKNVLIRMNPGCVQVKGVSLYSPDASSGRPHRLKVEKSGNIFEIIVPEVKVYSVLEIRF